MKTQVWKTLDLIKWGEEYFFTKGISNAKLEVEWLLCEILHCERIDLYVQFDRPLDRLELTQFRGCVSRRVSGEPFQHILGKSTFYGRDFKVNNHVLIPRPETELIIEILKKKPLATSVLDVGTGCGCIAITIVLEGLADTMIATDLSHKALEVARENSALFHVKNIDFKRHNFLKTEIHSRFDLVVSNPPYIGKSELSSLQNEVMKYEPELALTDNADGLTFYRRFAQVGKNILKRGGCLLLEFGGSEQLHNLKEIFQPEEFFIEFHNDLQGDPRIAEIHLSSY